jgi:hypothetical protein
VFERGERTGFPQFKKLRVFQLKNERKKKVVNVV